MENVRFYRVLLSKMYRTYYTYINFLGDYFLHQRHLSNHFIKYVFEPDFYDTELKTNIIDKSSLTGFFFFQKRVKILIIIVKPKENSLDLAAIMLNEPFVIFFGNSAIASLALGTQPCNYIGFKSLIGNSLHVASFSNDNDVATKESKKSESTIRSRSLYQLFFSRVVESNPPIFDRRRVFEDLRGIRRIFRDPPFFS